MSILPPTKSSSGIFNRGLKFSAVLAVSIHILILFLLSFSFFDSTYSKKPVLIFLGSFLRQQDIASQTTFSSDGRPLDLRTIRLDADQNFWPLDLSKPSLTQKTDLQTKQQYKPKAAQPLERPKRKERGELDIPIEPIPPVKMKISR